jgi:excisionase family DNA binding protein
MTTEVLARPGLPDVEPLVNMDTIPASDLRTPKDLAVRYGVMKRTVTKAIERGRLPAIRPAGGFQWYTTEAEFRRWLASGENRAGPVPKLTNPDPSVREGIPEFLLREADLG